uniref:Apocytochrome F n=1 Tax=Gymnochlora stellata TaxID=67809 RepID=A0A140JZF2_GYMST|nr:apocytochrome F [Gymnochlora stellata]BAU62479.1 apocytochrome F [Gymnochlora stellata]
MVNRKFTLFNWKGFISSLFIFSIFVSNVQAYPIFARQYFSSPREVSGRIACSYCHLAQKPIELIIPQSVFPNTVFEAVVKVPYNREVKQVSGQGAKVGLNIGAIVIFPEGFSLAPVDRLSPELKQKTAGLSFLPYNNNNKSTFLVGPVSGNKYEKLVFPMLSPNLDSKTAFLKSAVYAGGNRGRGQIYPNGEKSNNNLFASSVTGTVKEIQTNKNGSFMVSIETLDGNTVVENIGAGATILVGEGDKVKADQPLTTDPNVGGYGQSETEIALQNPVRVQGLLLFSLFILLTQISLVLKKKQFEKVQLFEMNF